MQPSSSPQPKTKLVSLAYHPFATPGHLVGRQGELAGLEVGDGGRERERGRKRRRDGSSAALHSLSPLGKQLLILLWVPWGQPSLPLPQASFEVFIWGVAFSPHVLSTPVLILWFTLKYTRPSQVCTQTCAQSTSPLTSTPAQTPTLHPH